MPALRSPTSGGRCGAVSVCGRPVLPAGPGFARPGFWWVPARPCPAVSRFRPALGPARPDPEGHARSWFRPAQVPPEAGSPAGPPGDEAAACVGPGRPGSRLADPDPRRQPRPVPTWPRNFGRPVTDLGNLAWSY